MSQKHTSLFGSVSAVPYISCTHFVGIWQYSLHAVYSYRNTVNTYELSWRGFSRLFIIRHSGECKFYQCMSIIGGGGGESGEGVSYRMELYAMLGSERARTSILHMLCPFLREPCVDELIGVCTTNVQFHGCEVMCASISLSLYIHPHRENRNKMFCYHYSTRQMLLD